jgi:hypothetical protein
MLGGSSHDELAVQSQNREVVTAATVAIPPTILKSPLGSKIFPRLQFLFFSIYRVVENGR